MPALFGLVKLTIVVATQFIVNLFLQHLKNLDFNGLGTVHYEHIQAALTTDEEAWKGGQLNDEVFIVQQFCQRIVDLLESLKERTGNRIANDVASVTKSDDPSASASAEGATSAETDASCAACVQCLGRKDLWWEELASMCQRSVQLGSSLLSKGRRLRRWPMAYTPYGCSPSPCCDTRREGDAS